jgi:NTP pyrophosphatase (non-canonical NTP hydrolase)
MNAQADVRTFLRKHGLAHPPSAHALDLVSEVGEVAKALLEASAYGHAPLQPTPALADELGDAFFSLLALAESLDIDLDAALHAALAKYTARLVAHGHAGSQGRQP